MPRIRAISFPINLQCILCIHLLHIHTAAVPCNERCISQRVIRCIAFHCIASHFIALQWVVVWQAIVRSILQALTGPETCWHKALTDILSMFSPNLRFHRTVNLHLCLVRHYKALDILCMFSLTPHTAWLMMRLYSSFFQTTQKYENLIGY